MVESYIVHPDIDQDSEPYWQSLREHSAKLQKCEHCGKFRFPPSPSCYYCGTPGGNWEVISGQGDIYSWAEIHHPIDKRLATDVPFTIVLVDLEEGPRIAGRLINAGQSEIKAGMPVKVRYDDIDAELTLLNFEPRI
jgi:uncharacterized OB-fold protein